MVLLKSCMFFFCDEIKELFVNSFRTALEKKELSNSQKQAITKLKNDRDKRFIKNLRPISLLNVDYKKIAKGLAARLKYILPKIISSKQSAYVKNRFIREIGRLISDTTKVAYLVNIETISLPWMLKKLLIL